ncbi:MAG: uroporphyrinogen decarboxylase family protein [Candidatus Bathyarchaeia archaeon]
MSEMNARERFLAIAEFKKPDMVPVGGGPRKATLERWYEEGLPRNVDLSTYFKFTQREDITSCPGQGFEHDWDIFSSQGINLGPSPPFEYKILEKNDRYWVWIDSLGITQRGFKEDWENGWCGFATRQFLEFPVKDRASFLEVKKKYEPRIPEIYPKNWNETVQRLSRRDYPLNVVLRGPFWWTRDMMGLKNMLLAMYTDPGLIRDIMDFCAEFQTTVLEKALDEVDADSAVFNEDMAYKKGPMIGPSAFKEFMFKPYREMCSFLKEHGVAVIEIDSDGNSEPLINLWVEAGINSLSPCEIAANMDPLRLRKSYPRLILRGGIDKRELAKNRQAIENEVLSKVPYLIEKGGYFPGVDHGVPPDISLDNFKYFLNFTRRICGWPEEYTIH